MTLNEFKAWLEGYRESFKDGTPSKKQFKEIMQRLEKVRPDIKTIDKPNQDILDRWKHRRDIPKFEAPSHAYAPTVFVNGDEAKHSG